MLTRSANGTAQEQAQGGTIQIDMTLSPSSTCTSVPQPAARDSLSFDAPQPLPQPQQIEIDSEEEEDEILLATLPSLTKEQVQREVLTIEDEDEDEEDQGLDASDQRFQHVVLPAAGGGEPFKLVDGQRRQLTEQDKLRREEWNKGWELEVEGEGEGRDESMEEEDEEEEDEEEDEDDEMSDGKSEGEMEAIQYEMAKLTENVPALIGSYKLVDRLGEGTFSSVYKAIDLKHSQYDNSVWSPTSLDPVTGLPQPKAGKVYVALKRIYVTSSPIRIQNELDILNDLRGTNNVAYLIAALRHEDQVIAIMPFNRHQDFRTYYRTTSLPLLRSYFSCLFRALASTHTQQIIHRDVKPANFLFDTLTGTGVLCDYGLAQKIGGDEWYEWKSDCCHSLPGPSWGGLEGRVRSQRKTERLQVGTPPGLASGLHGVRLGRPLSLYEQSSKQEQEYRYLSRRIESQLLASRSDPSIEPPTAEEVEQVKRMKPWIMPEGWRDDLKGRWRERQGFLKGWRPATLVQSQAAGGQGGRVGYLKEDRRPSVRANRAGTRGFRAPEVLLKCPDQTVSIDIWSAGIILLCFLTRRFPFFNSNDDTEALAEIAAIFGKRKMERCAALHNRTFITNIPTFDAPPHPTLHALVKALNPPIFTDLSPDPYGPIPSTEESDKTWYEGSELMECVDLMRRCLELDCTKRWTAEECLEHPFFNGMYDVGMGVLAPRGSQYM